MALYFTILEQVAIMCSFQILTCKTILLIFLVLCWLKGMQIKTFEILGLTFSSSDMFDALPSVNQKWAQPKTQILVTVTKMDSILESS